MGFGQVPARVLVVDDDELVLRVMVRLLEDAGFHVLDASSGAAGIQVLRHEHVDAVLSDIAMPGMGGIEFLREVRRYNLDVPVILMTGNPALTTAIEAVEYGAFSYLIKPVDAAELMACLRRAVRLHAVARLKRQALMLAGNRGHELGDRASLEARFERARDTLWPAFHPIVLWPERRIYSYEALARNDEPTLARPDDLLRAAERLNRVHELGRVIRTHIAAAAAELPPDRPVFVNLHPHDFGDEDLYAPDAPLSRIAGRVVLEITERASLEGISELAVRVQRLRDLGFRIAVDDLGAGYAGLASFVQLEPDIIKLDRSLVADVHHHMTKREVIRSMVQLCRQLGMEVVSEGVETVAELRSVLDLGCDLVQGYLFGRPCRRPTPPAWPDLDAVAAQPQPDSPHR
jgi:EAL domain-containing protein (putative c-di-GMP-specific phosphodiesterase class I)/CheY-like chemotaxis protein